LSCPCLYPLIVIEKLEDDSELIFYGMPEDEEMRKPGNIELIEETTDSGKKEEFVAVMWKKPTDFDHVKRYEVNNHYVYAGCNNDSTTVIDGQMKCDRKDLYIVLHPVKEWVKDHIIER